MQLRSEQSTYQYLRHCPQAGEDGMRSTGSISASSIRSVRKRLRDRQESYQVTLQVERRLQTVPILILKALPDCQEMVSFSPIIDRTSSASAGTKVESSFRLTRICAATTRKSVI